jgi:hypothetical protein
MATAQKKDNNIVTIKDVIFMWSSVNRAVEQKNEDNKPPLSDDPLEFHSYEIKVLITDEKFKSLKKAYKGARNWTYAKEFEKEELESKYTDVDFSSLDSDDLVLIKFASTCLTGKQGKRVPSRPIELIGIKGRVQDKDGQPVNQETEFSNGSKGHFQFRVSETKYGLYLYPQLVCLTELIEYTGGTGEPDYDSLGLEELDDVDVKAVAKEAKKEAVAKAAMDAVEAEAEEKEDDTLF